MRVFLAVIFVALTQAIYHPTNARVGCLSNIKSGAKLLKEAVECANGDATFIGWYCDPNGCAAAVRSMGGSLFKWGDGSGKFTKDRIFRKSKAGWVTTSECWMENVSPDDCKVKDAQFDVYQATDPPMNAKATLIKKNVECSSNDAYVEAGKGSVLECRNAVKAMGGKFFIFGIPHGGKEYKCWIEYTGDSKGCKSYEPDAYDFWAVDAAPGASASSYTCYGRCASGRSCKMPSGQCRPNNALDRPVSSCAGACASGNCCNRNTLRCETCGTFTEEAIMDSVTVQMPTEGDYSLVVKVFAAIGLSSMLYGAARFYLSK